MAVTIVTSLGQTSFNYSHNRFFLHQGLSDQTIRFQGTVVNSNHQYPWNKRSVYDFTRTAKAEIGVKMVNWLVTTLPGLEQHRQELRIAFDDLFNYYYYKGHLNMRMQQRHESMGMLIFNPNQQYVAHVYFSSTSIKGLNRLFTVEAAITSQRFTYFPYQAINIDQVLQGLQNLQL